MRRGHTRPASRGRDDKLTIRVKVLLISGVALLVTAGMMYVTSRFTFIRGITNIEENHAANTVVQMLNAYSYVVSRLEADTANRASSDEIYRAVAEGVGDYTESYLREEAFTELGLNLMVLIDNDGAVVLGRASDQIAGAEAALPPSLHHHLASGSPLLNSDGQAFASGIIVLEEGPLLVASQPILTSRGEGPAHGTVIFGRYLDAVTVGDLARVVGFPMMMHTIDGAPHPKFAEALAALTAQEPLFVKQLDEQRIAGYSLLSDIYGEPAAVLMVDIPRDAFQLGQLAVIYYILSVLGAGVVVAGGAVLMLQKQVLARFGRLMRGISAITESGDTSQRVSVGGSDELTSIAGTINGMLAALEETAGEVRRSEDELRVLYEREKGTRQELEEETKKRTEFTRALVHELRTPITPVLAAAEMLLDSSLDNQSRRLVESIARSASNLNRRIDELIDLIRGETDMLPLVNAPVNIVSLLRDLGDEMAPVATAEGHRLTVDLPPSRVDVWGDSDRLRQVVQNLMNNAIKFTPAGGEIALLARLDGDRLVVEVHDSGPGIAEEDMVRLFDPYYRRVEDRERLSGLGLGLALAKKLVELHGGEIWVKSRPGEGTTLGFSLPLMGDADNGGDGNQVTE